MTKLLTRIFRRRKYRGTVNLTAYMRERGWKYLGSHYWEHPVHGVLETPYAVFEHLNYEHGREMKTTHVIYLIQLAALQIAMWLSIIF